MFAVPVFDKRLPPSVMISSRALPSLAALMLLATAPARADEIENKTSMFAGLDKITGRIVKFEAAIGETVQFGSLQITPKSCYTKPPTEAPQTVGFVKVDEVDAESKVKEIFSGWMFAASPGLNGVEHPVYDVWLLDCKNGFGTLPETAEAAPPAGLGSSAPPTDAKSAAAPTKPARSIEDILSEGPPPADSPAAPAAAPSQPRQQAAKPIKTGAPAPALAPPVEIGDAPVDRAGSSAGGAAPAAPTPNRPAVQRHAAAPSIFDQNDPSMAAPDDVAPMDAPDPPPPRRNSQTLRPPGLIPN